MILILKSQGILVVLVYLPLLIFRNLLGVLIDPANAIAVIGAISVTRIVETTFLIIYQKQKGVRLSF